MALKQKLMLFSFFLHVYILIFVTKNCFRDFKVLSLNIIYFVIFAIFTYFFTLTLRDISRISITSEVEFFMRLDNDWKSLSGVVVITTTQLHSAKLELMSCPSSNPARGVLDVYNGENIWQWSQLEIRINVFVGQPFCKNNSWSSSSSSLSSSSLSMYVTNICHKEFHLRRWRILYASLVVYCTLKLCFNV